MQKHSMRPFLAGLLFFVFTGSCKNATQVTFDITTDVPCSDVGGTSITVGIEGQTERAEPVTVTTSCTAGNTVAAIGTYAVAPKSKDAVASFKVAVAVTPGLNVETDCTASKKYAGCIVARRRISFVPTRGLTVPVQIFLICKDVQCDENSTCNRAGKCVSSLTDLAQCDAQGVCRALTTAAGEGLPCAPGSFNGNADAGACVGDDGWCVEGAGGIRTCSADPSPNGLSYQCRDSRDCGPNLFCVQGTGSIVGRCSPTRLPGDHELCTLGQPMTPCTNPLDCEVDAGLGLLTCSSTGVPDAGINGTGLHCPRESAMRCGGETPYCSEYGGVPQCVADGGAQCWYSGDCAMYLPKRPDGGIDAGTFDAGTLYCFAGTNAPFANLCAPAATAGNPVALCDPTVTPNGDCPLGTICDGTFYGKKACAACPTDLADCDGQLANLCEVNFKTDVNNCGRCGSVCPKVPNGEPACVNGRCTVQTCDAGWNDCDTYFPNGCEMKPNNTCTPILATAPLCRWGTSSCNGQFQRSVCIAGNVWDAGTPCGDGGTCSSNGDCQCQAGTPVNTPCGLDSVCNATGQCVRNRFWDRNYDCNVNLTGDSICQFHGYARARTAWGYTWSECGGPNYITQVGVDECLTYDSERSRCLSWESGVACNGISLTAFRYGVTTRELGDGGGAYPFAMSEFWGRGCGGWFAGISIRVYCEY